MDLTPELYHFDLLAEDFWARLRLDPADDFTPRLFRFLFEPLLCTSCGSGFTSNRSPPSTWRFFASRMP